MPGHAHRQAAGRVHRTGQHPGQGRAAFLAIYDGLNVWNNFILPLVLTQSSNVSVLPLGHTKFQGQYAINVPAVMAAVLLSVLPLVALFAAMRRPVMRSLGAVVMR